MFGPQVSIIFVPTFHCNCNCAYCFEPRTRESMSLEDLETVFSRISSYLSRSGVKSVDVYWQGGEITVLSPEWCLTAGRMIRSFMSNHNLKIKLYLQTNLMDYDPVWDPVIWELFDGTVGSSLDYPNVHRRFRGLSGDSYNEHWADRYRIARSRGLSASVISVPNKQTLSVSPSDFYRYYVDELGLKSIQLNTPFASGPASHLADQLFLDPSMLGDFLVGLLDVYFSGDDGVRLDPYEGIVERITLGDAAAKIPCFFCPNCVNGFFCVGPGGEVSQCDAWMGSYPDRNFGNLLESDDLGMLLTSPMRMKLAERTANLIGNSECLDCKYLPLCNGGCPVRAMSAEGSPDHPDPYCETYKKVFAFVEDRVLTNPKKWQGWTATRADKSRSLVWGWPEPGAVVFSSFECTNNCIFCAPAYDRSKNPPNLDQEVFDFIEESSRAGIKTLFFTGAGEPTLNPSLVNYVRFAKEHGIDNLFMFTNGFGITEELVFSLTNAGMKNFWVSLHGVGETHDRIVRRKGSFVEAYRAVSLINDVSPERLSVNTCLNELNLPEIEWLMDKILGFAGTTAHCLCLPEWDGNAYVNRGRMCRLSSLKEKLSTINSQEYPLTILDNVPYCIAPHLPHIGNCRNEVRIKRREADDMVSNADNMGHNETPKACLKARCCYIDHCVGVDRRYLEQYGEGEISVILVERRL